MIQKKIASLLFVCLLTPVFALAQNTPEPGSVAEPAVPCTGCPGTNDGKPTYPYDVPLSDHVGRIVDSLTTANVQNLGMRTLRAEKVRMQPSRDRVYIQLGSTIAAYTLSTFFTGTLQQPMVTVNTLQTGGPQAYTRFGDPFERLARPDAFIYAESNVSGWTFGLQDSQLQLSDFDSDDRGYVYLSTISFGWGIHFDDGRTNAKHLPFVFQDANNLDMDSLFTLKSGDQYFVVGGNSDHRWVFDVTNPTTPTMTTHRDGGIARWAKLEGGDRIAIYDVVRTSTGSVGTLRIYTTAALLTGGAAIAEYPLPNLRSFTDFSFDEDGNLWATERLQSGPGGWLWKLAPAASPNPSYVKTVSEAGMMTPMAVHAAAGYLAIAGSDTEPDDTTVAQELHLYKLVNGTPQLVDTHSYFRRHYYRAPEGYGYANARSPSYLGVRDLFIVPQNGLTYLMYNAGGLGDVYELGEVLRPPQVKITSISPLTGPPAGGTAVTINGRNFGQDSVVKFGNAVAATTFVSPFQLTAVTPKGSGFADVTVATAGQLATSPQRFTYVVPYPSNLVAKATGTTSVIVTWTPAASAAQYEVWRYIDGAFAPVGRTANLAFAESGLTPDTAYVYRVHALDPDDNLSAPSLRDIATTMQFTDPKFVAGLPIKAAHVVELRQAVNLARAAAGLSPATFSGPVAPGTRVQAVHLEELRTAVQPAVNFFGAPASFTEWGLAGTPVKALHFQELLNVVQ